MNVALLIGLAYALGSVPFAYLLARQWADVDVRAVGSGNVGATNVLRHANPLLALAVVLLDVGKGTLVIWLGRRAGLSTASLAIVGLAAIVGHIYPIWLRFKGGKGVATTCGVFGLLAPRATLAALIVFVVIVWVSRYVSVGSLIGAATLVGGAYGFSEPPATVVAACVASLLIAVRHRDNIARLWQGVEHRLGADRAQGA